MRTSPSWLFLTAVAYTLMASASADAGFTVGGTLSDWGIVVTDGAASHAGPGGANVGTNWSAVSGVGGPYNLGNLASGTQVVTTGAYVSPLSSGALVVQYAVEDTNDGWISNQVLGPDGGGQNYDAEFMGVALDSTNQMMYIAVVSGQRPDNGFSVYSPGDIIIRTPAGSNPKYGIEVGGSSGAGAINNLTTAGTTYSINGSGNTTVASAEATRTAGKIVQFNGAADWVTESVGSGSSVVQIASGFNNIVGTAGAYYFSRDTVTTEHSIIEMAIPFAQFGIANPDFNGWSFSWMPSCGNDQVALSVTFDNITTETPEPTSMLLTGLGALGFIGFRRRQRTKVAA